MTDPESISFADYRALVERKEWLEEEVIELNRLLERQAGEIAELRGWLHRMTAPQEDRRHPVERRMDEIDGSSP